MLQVIVNHNTDTDDPMKWMATGFNYEQGLQFFSLALYPNQLCGPPNHMYNGYQELFHHG